MSNQTDRYQEIRQKYADKIENSGNPNLADTIRTSTAKKLAEQDKIDAWIEIFPEQQKTLENLWKEMNESVEENRQLQNPEAYFETLQGQRTFRNNWLANHIEEKYKFKYIEETERFYIYNGKKWEDKAERIVKEECNDRLQDEYTPSRANKVVDTIKTRSNIRTQKQDFRPAPNKIPFQNGTYNLETQELEEFKPEDNFTYIIPWEYNPEAQCPEIHDFLDQILENERDKETILETIGYSMLGDYPYSHALMLFGSGKNGKSVLLEIWKKLLSEKNYKEEKLQELENSRFATQSLYRKLAVFNDDLPGTKLESGSTLKALTGGGEVRAEYKNGAHFQFKNFATPVFACNEIPESEDDSDGFYRRWEIINFPYKFVDEPKRSFEKERMPKDQLLEKLTSKQEIQGLINEALVCLELMKEQGGFTYKTDAESTRTLWKSYSDPVDQFIEVCLEQGMTQQDAREVEGDIGDDLSEYSYDFIRKDDLVFLIDKYCEYFDSKAPSKTAVTRKLKHDSPYYVQEGRTRQLSGDNKRTRVYKFIKFSDEFIEFLEKGDRLKGESVPSVLGFPETQREHALSIVQKYRESQDTKDTISLGEKIKNFIENNGEEAKENEVIEEIEEERDKVDKRMQQLINQGELYRPKPGVVAKL